MSTPEELLAQSIAKGLSANRIDGTRASYRKDNPGEYLKVVAYLNGGVRPSDVGSDMGLHLVLEEDARRALGVVEPPPPSGAIIFQDDFETNYPATNGLNPSARPAQGSNPPGTPGCYTFTGRATWYVNKYATATIANVVPPTPGKGLRAMRFDLPVSGENNHAFGELRHNRTNGEMYYGTMLYLPATWREPAGAADDGNNAGYRWGSILHEIGYPPFIQNGAEVATHLHADSIKMSVGSGDGVFGTLHSSGSGRYTRYANSGGFLWDGGNLGPNYDWMVVPQGQLTKEVWHEIIIGVNWTFGPANGGSNAFWKAWWRRKGESTWKQTVNVTGPYPSRWWGKDMYGCTFTAQQMIGVASYSNLGPYRARSNFPLTYWADNYVEATTFDAVAATMP